MRAGSEPAGRSRPLTAVQRLLFWFVWGFTRVTATLFFDLRVRGLRAIPARGGALLVANHQSHLDVMILGLASARPIHFIARRTLARNRFMRFILWVTQAILAERDGADREAFHDAVALLKAGELVAVFPEGTRSADGTVGEFKRGAELIARRANVPVFPVALVGTYAAWPRHRWRPRPGRVEIRVGRPIPPGGLAELDLRERVLSLLAGSGAPGKG